MRAVEQGEACFAIGVIYQIEQLLSYSVYTIPVIRRSLSTQIMKTLAHLRPEGRPIHNHEDKSAPGQNSALPMNRVERTTIDATFSEQGVHWPSASSPFCVSIEIC